MFLGISLKLDISDWELVKFLTGRMISDLVNLLNIGGAKILKSECAHLDWCAPSHADRRAKKAQLKIQTKKKNTKCGKKKRLNK